MAGPQSAAPVSSEPDRRIVADAAAISHELAMKKLSAAALADLLELTARMLHSRGYALDLFPAQWTALRYLAKCQPDRATASDLARFQGLANGPVSRTVRTLIQKGLVEKAAEQPRGRAERLVLSASGRAMLGSDPMVELEAVLAGIEPGDQEALARALEAIIRKMSSPNAVS